LFKEGVHGSSPSEGSIKARASGFAYVFSRRGASGALDGAALECVRTRRDFRAWPQFVYDAEALSQASGVRSTRESVRPACHTMAKEMPRDDV
jgi:hypothetical protein